MGTHQFFLVLLNCLLVLQLSTCDEEAICTINDDGTETCIEPSDDTIVKDHNEHIWALPKNYDCENKRAERDCDHWVHKTDACANNPAFMILSCPKSCGFCHLLDPTVRCQRHPNAKPAVGVGDINKMFERLLTDFPQYNPQVLSRDPWLVQLHNVFSDEECDTMIKIGGRNFRRSVDAGKRKGDSAKFEEIVSDSRTSSTDWCTRDCWDHPIINAMAKKAENITMIPKENSEYFQVLRYEMGQYYVRHHDYIRGHNDLPIGPRVYTFFIYLNTPEEGGGTRFGKLGQTVQPVKGSVAIWPSVLDSNPFKKEWRTSHEALPVDYGVKYAANMWLHMFNFHDPYKITCTG